MIFLYRGDISNSKHDIQWEIRGIERNGRYFWRLEENGKISNTHQLCSKNKLFFTIMERVGEDNGVKDCS